MSENRITLTVIISLLLVLIINEFRKERVVNTLNVNVSSQGFICDQVVTKDEKKYCRMILEVEMEKE